MSKTLFEGDTQYGHYKVVDTIYGGRTARVLYSGNHLAAQSGVAYDDNDDLLFDYNQRLYELATGILPRTTLLIGGGAFTLPAVLTADMPDMSLDVVELDSDLLDISRNYFDYTPTSKTRIFHGDGFDYLKKATKTYTLIILDVYTHASIPEAFQTEAAMRAVDACLVPDGVVAMNVIAAYYGKRSAVLIRMLEALESVFTYIEVYPASRDISLWIPQNFVVIASNQKRDYGQYLRHAVVS